MSARMRRVNEAVRAVVAEAVGELKDPRIGLVTVTGVSVSPDLREGTVYVSVLGNEKKRLATLAGLESAHAVVQARLGRELRMKRTPHLTFEYDPSVEQAVRISRLIDEVAPDDDPCPDRRAPPTRGDRRAKRMDQELATGPIPQLLVAWRPSRL